MKKIVTIAMSALLILGLAACGGNSGNSGGNSGNSETADVDLESFYTGLAEEYGWTEDVENIGPNDLLLSTIEGEMLESYYPGLSEIPAKQLVAKAPAMSAVVNEVVFIQCETEEDAEKAAEIFQARIDYQVGDETNPGGAWYPESIAVVNEVVFIQCETEEDAEKAAEIFQARIDYQVGDETNPGGAWYPESIESWKQAQVVQEGTYAALIAVNSNGAEIAETFAQQFQ